jgi:hypothetical protein
VVTVTKNTRIAVAALAVAVLVAVVLAGVLRHKGSRLGRQKDSRPAVAIAVGEIPPEPSVWIDIHSPDKLWKSARSNVWLARALSEPLGQGMAAGWAGFLATKGGDLSGAFEGVVLDLVADRLLADPFRLVFFTGPAATGAPAIVVPRPSSGAQNAYALLEGAARNGSYQAQNCPGPAPKEPQSISPIVVSRWLLAEHAIFAGQRDGRLALAKNPAAVIQALCAVPPEVPAAQGIDVSLSFSRDALGREAQVAAALLGLGPAPRLAFAVEGDHLEPRGLLGELSEPGRLDSAAPAQSLTKLIPADAGVVFMATLRLPEKLTRESLAQHLKKSYQGKLAPRSVAVVWNPRGSGALPTEVAVAWPEKDSALLREAFSGPNRMERRRVCGHEVFASTGALATAIQATCEGRSPSLLNAAPAVVEGLKQPASITVGFHFGVVLSRLLGDAYATDAAAVKKATPEIESARRLLEELPFVGLRGVAKDGALVPGGFRS